MENQKENLVPKIINNRMSEEKQIMQNKYIIKYPIQHTSYVKGPGKLYSIPYSPIYRVPNIDSTNCGWTVETQDDEFTLYDKVNKICNLYLTHRYVLYMDCTTLTCLNQKELEKIRYTCFKNDEYIDLETARCRNIADQIRSYTLNKYSMHYAGRIIYSYSLKSYIPVFEWNYFSMSPFLSILYREVCKEIHKAFGFFYVIITFNLDANLYPYIEVLISNRTKNNLYQNVYLSKDAPGMYKTIDKLRNSLYDGIRSGTKIIIDLINEHNGVYNYIPQNDPEAFRKFASPSMSDLNFDMNISNN